MTPLAAHNAVASIVEMYREALTELTAKNIALTTEVAALRKELESLRALQKRSAAPEVQGNGSSRGDLARDGQALGRSEQGQGSSGAEEAEAEKLSG